ncbi:MAG: hypothetical protein QXX20_06980 [Candidatus Thermoplasmatota archaeon]
MVLNIKIIDFKDEHDDDALRLFYRSVFYNRKEFEYARLPSWKHRYTLEEENIKYLAYINDEIAGSLGLISYHSYIQRKKVKIGFFVDNCVDPKFYKTYNEIMFQLFEKIEQQALEKDIDYIIGWDYTVKADEHNELFKKMGYQRLDGINWFGGGTTPLSVFKVEGFTLSFLWRVLMSSYDLKYYFKERKLKPLNDTIIRTMEDSDIHKAVELINTHNEKLNFSPRYTTDSLKASIKKYKAEGLVAEKNNTIVGVAIFFAAPWSGWMYGKPAYTKSYGFLLIKHPLEFAVQDNSEEIASQILSKAMKTEKNRKHLMLVDVFDRRIDWMKKAFLAIGADEIPYDYGTIFIKNLSENKIDLSNPIYTPTNLIISPYTEKY